MQVNKFGSWQLFWGIGTLPAGAEPIGTIHRDGEIGGALLRMPSGLLVQGNAGVLRTLPQSEALSLGRVSGPEDDSGLPGVPSDAPEPCRDRERKADFFLEFAGQLKHRP